MDFLNVYKGGVLPDGRTEVISGAKPRPIRMLVPADKTNEFVAQQKAYGVKDVSVGKPVKDGRFVEVFITPEQTQVQKYAVPSDKADEFISEQKKSAKKNLGIILTISAGLTALGTWGLSKLKIKSKWVKYPLVAVGALTALAGSFLVSMSAMVPVLSKQEKNMMQKYNAQRLQ